MTDATGSGNPNAAMPDLSLQQTPPQQQPGAPGPAAPPAPAAAAAADEKSRRLNSAVGFLKNPNVRATTLARRVNFLRGKGMLVDEIMEAFARAGQPQNKQAVQDILDGKSTSQNVAPPPPLPPGQAPSPSTAPPLPGAAPPPGVQYVYLPHPAANQQQATPQPTTPHTNVPQVLSGWTWKDYFIGATVATVGSALALKAVNAFSPYSVVHKSELAPPRPLAPPPMLAAVPSPPPPPVETTTATRPLPAGLPEVAPPTDGLSEEVASLKQQLEEEKKNAEKAAENLEKALKEKAAMNAANGKLRGNALSSSRTIEQLRQKVEELERAKAEAATAHRVEEEGSQQPPAAAPGPVEAESSVSFGAAASGDSVQQQQAVPGAEPPATAPLSSDAEAADVSGAGPRTTAQNEPGQPEDPILKSLAQ